jgi:hypothetical protein
MGDAANANLAALKNLKEKHEEIEKILKYIRGFKHIEGFDKKEQDNVKYMKERELNSLINKLITAFDNSKISDKEKHKWVPQTKMEEYKNIKNQVLTPSARTSTRQSALKPLKPLQPLRPSARQSALPPLRQSALQPIQPSIRQSALQPLVFNKETHQANTRTTGTLYSQEPKEKPTPLVETRTQAQILYDKRQKKQEKTQEKRQQEREKNRQAREALVSRQPQHKADGLKGVPNSQKTNTQTGNIITRGFKAILNAFNKKPVVDIEKLNILNRINAITLYIDLRFNYLHQFIQNIFDILDAYNIGLNIFTEELDNIGIILDDIDLLSDEVIKGALDISQLFVKMDKHNEIIVRFINCIKEILPSQFLREFLAWISSTEGKNIRKLSYQLILIDEGYTQEDINSLLDFDDIPDEYQSNNLLVSLNPKEEYDTAVSGYIPYNKLITPITYSGGGGMTSRTAKGSVAPEPTVEHKKPQKPLGDINFESFKGVGIKTMEEYISGDIIQFFNILNNVLKYIDIIALYIKLDKDIITTQDDDIRVSLKLSNIISDSDDYLKNLRTRTLSSPMSSMTSNLKSHLSIYLYYNQVENEVLYTRMGTGGRKRAIGRPRKTPVKSAKKTVAKPAKKPTTKPVKKPSTKPAKKPATKPAKKPIAKPAKKPSTKPAKPSKKPTKPTAKKPTTKKPTKPTTKKPTKK